MKRLTIPESQLKIQREDDVIKVFDPLRKLWVVLTPEEYVRQQFTAWLRSSLGYPASLMANEIGVEVNGQKLRCDTVIFDRKGMPMIIVEYKAPDVKVTQDVFDQIVRYNMRLKARYLIVSNGCQNYCCRIDYERNQYHFIPSIPPFSELHTACEN